MLFLYLAIISHEPALTVKFVVDEDLFSTLPGPDSAHSVNT